MKFNEFNLNERLLESVSYLGFDEATPVQEQSMPVILKGHDVIACAQTGTGKTAAYLLPVLNSLIEKGGSGIRTLIIVPTRELAIQIGQQVMGIGYMANITPAVIYGGGDGSDWEQQKQALQSGSALVVATPGKLLSHMKMGYVRFDNLRHLILDEADRMLDIGFHEELLNIVSYLPQKRQTLMFSATMPGNIRSFANKILDHPEEVSIEVSKPAEGVLQAAYLVYENQKSPLINELIKDKPEYHSILIFCSTKKKVAELARTLKKNQYQVEAMSSDLDQSERNQVMNRFKARQTRILVATDVLSRGIDIKDINLVVNYDVPSDAEDYVHRVGRTARADTTGVALTLVSPDDMHSFRRIEQLIDREVTKLPPPPGIGEGPAWRDRGPKRKKRGYSGKGRNRK
jgi:superfamily II DNA/RNA helicase